MSISQWHQDLSVGKNARDFRANRIDGSRRTGRSEDAGARVIAFDARIGPSSCPYPPAIRTLPSGGRAVLELCRAVPSDRLR